MRLSWARGFDDITSGTNGRLVIFLKSKVCSSNSVRFERFPKRLISVLNMVICTSYALKLIVHRELRRTALLSDALEKFSAYTSDYFEAGL